MKTTVVLTLFGIASFSWLIVSGNALFVAVFIEAILLFVATLSVVLGLTLKWTVVRLLVTTLAFSLVTYALVLRLISTSDYLAQGGAVVVRDGGITSYGLYFASVIVAPHAAVFFILCGSMVIFSINKSAK